MYERNAIVLERYLEEKLEYKGKCNLKENYNNYRRLIEAYEKYKTATSNEDIALGEFEKVSNEIKKLQKSQERLYNKGAKLEYSRYIIFENIDEKPAEVERCLLQVEDEVDKNNEALKALGNEFLEKVNEYNNKKIILDRCQKESKETSNIYEENYKLLTEIYQNISAEQIKKSNEFINSDNKELIKDLINVLSENGKNERNPFDDDVISNAVNTSIDIWKKELDVYYTSYDKTKKLLEELANDDVKLDKHNKFLNDSKIKIDFLVAEKEYLVQFLDNERVTAIYDKKVHRKLMLEACKNLNLDLNQINNLYEIILKEIAGRSTKKIYKENYNKSYLIEIEQSAESAQREREKVKINAIAVMNLNYWRIEGIRRIYEVFDKDVQDLFGKDLSEFEPEIPKVEEVEEQAFEPISAKNKKNIDTKLDDVFAETDENIDIEDDQLRKSFEDRDRIKAEINDIDIFGKVETPSFKNKRKKCKRLTSSKKALANAIYISLQAHDFENGKVKTENNESNEEGEYFDIEAKMASLDFDAETETVKNSNEEEQNVEEEADESILDLYFSENSSDEKKENNVKKSQKEINVEKKGNIFKKIINMNSKKRKEA